MCLGFKKRETGEENGLAGPDQDWTGTRLGPPRGFLHYIQLKNKFGPQTSSIHNVRKKIITISH